MANLSGRYVKCSCGKSDGNDRIDGYSIVERSYNASEMVVRETRKCNVCHEFYHVIMHYKLEYEEVETDDQNNIVILIYQYLKISK